MKLRLLLLPLVLLAFSSWAQPATPPGRLEQLGEIASRFVQPRRVSVWLPPGYNSRRHYPVLYMHDGQNLFEPATSYGGTAWEIDSVLTQLIGAKEARPCIVVGVWNTDRRFREYAPAKPYAAIPEARRAQLAQERPGTPLSDDYLKFLVQELKPRIDSLYSTSPRRQDTFVAGSSMGGLISLYAALEYPEVFGGAACLSTHWPLSLKQNTPDFTTAMLAYLQPRLTGRLRPRLYFDYGTTTLDAWYEPHQQRVDSLLRAVRYPRRSWLSRKYAGAAHNEAAWQQRVAVPLRFLLGR
ncbi:alpha/beta hydrolase [Hymenobacter puniceus]|uniref:alpha/beta hydrolase n=1 Tax=Hymenobacter sp. BT190 TaxID=2763505 RepID=UPI0016511641|nr:alpha/beta hydrolase-fold protein [Hymenobacter sp. BT190]MBC6697107.1 esterase family protein [Hymenobacter sp. BT190]